MPIIHHFPLFPFNSLLPLLLFPFLSLLALPFLSTPPLFLFSTSMPLSSLSSAVFLSFSLFLSPTTPAVRDLEFLERCMKRRTKQSWQKNEESCIHVSITGWQPPTNPSCSLAECPALSLPPLCLQPNPVASELFKSFCNSSYSSRSEMEFSLGSRPKSLKLIHFWPPCRW